MKNLWNLLINKHNTTQFAYQNHCTGRVGSFVGMNSSNLWLNYFSIQQTVEVIFH